MFKKYYSEIGRRVRRVLRDKLRVKLTKTLASSALSMAIDLVGISIGGMVARALDYVEGWYGYSRNNGYVFN